jgi:hypothetical protein
LYAKGYGDFHHDGDGTPHNHSPSHHHGYCQTLNEQQNQGQRNLYTSTQYTFCLYPTQEYYDSLSTNNPRPAAIGAVLVIVLTSIMFVFYDVSVRRDLHHKGTLLEAKRRFMRFVRYIYSLSNYDGMDEFRRVYGKRLCTLTYVCVCVRISTVFYFCLSDVNFTFCIMTAMR